VLADRPNGSPRFARLTHELDDVLAWRRSYGLHHVLVGYKTVPLQIRHELIEQLVVELSLRPPQQTRDVVDSARVPSCGWTHPALNVTVLKEDINVHVSKKVGIGL